MSFFITTSVVQLNAFILSSIADNESDLQKAAQYLLESCKPGASICLICIASIKHIDAVSFYSSSFQ